MKNGLTIALAIGLVLGAAAAWGSCAVPHRAGHASSGAIAWSPGGNEGATVPLRVRGRG
jgi:hypothetical protein